MTLQQIKTWTVSADHTVRPKNDLPSYEWWDSHHDKEEWDEFEQECKKHAYHTDPTLAPGDYPADKFGDVVWQYSVTSGRSWEIEIDEDTHRDSLNVGLLTRQYLPLAAPISNENKEGEVKQQEGEWISVKDRLPEIGVNVIIHCIDRDFENYPEVVIGWVYRIMDNIPWWQSIHANEDEDLTITHWMPLPKPPKV